MGRHSGLPAPDGGFRIESTGPELESRGGIYGAGQARCSAAGRLPVFEKQYAHWVVGAVVSGVFRYSTEREQMLAVPGSILFGSPGEAFTCQHLGPSGNRRSVIAVGFGLMADVAESLGLDDLAFGVAAVPPAPQTAALYGAIRYLTRSEDVLEESLVELIGAALAFGRRRPKWRHRPQDDKRVMDIVNYLEDSFTEPHCLSQLAGIAHLSRFHFIRVFREATGVSPHQFLIGLRLRAASERLRTSSLAVTRVALESGFDDISHFNRTFRRTFGVSPCRWRERGQ